MYDCFTFKNELLLLDLRLHELSEAVDFFVLVEGTRSFTNRPKPLYFLENLERFKPFLDRIIHIIVDDFRPIPAIGGRINFTNATRSKEG